jgi:nitrogen fixation protein NifQ
VKRDHALSETAGHHDEAASPHKLLDYARRPTELLTIAFAGVIAQASIHGRRPWIRGLSDARFKKLLNEYFLTQALSNESPPTHAGMDEFDDLAALLLEYRAQPTEQLAWLALAIASAAMGENHLWQDMGLPNRKVLSELMTRCFPALAAKNTGDMKWKKFFYRELCERAQVPICKSPHCAECCDYTVCFGAED